MNRERLETWTRVMAIERVTVGVLLGLAPGLAVKVFGLPPDADTPPTRMAARLFAVRNVSLGVLLWQARDDRSKLANAALLNAATEGADALAAAVPLIRRQGMDRVAISAMAVALMVAAGFLRLRSLAEADG